MQTSNQEDVIEIDLQDLFGLLLHKAWIINSGNTGYGGYRIRG